MGMLGNLSLKMKAGRTELAFAYLLICLSSLLFKSMSSVA